MIKIEIHKSIVSEYSITMSEENNQMVLHGPNNELMTFSKKEFYNLAYHELEIICEGFIENSIENELNEELANEEFLLCWGL